jgi:glucan 1,3-beta-glucosidase
MDPSSKETFFDNACAQKRKIAALEAAFGPVIVGEWSLATDNCAMWLNGFNDNLPGYPKLPCKYVECAKPYMGPEQPGAPPDPAKPIQGPFGTGMSGPSFGLCPADRDWSDEGYAQLSDEKISWQRAPAEALKGHDATDQVISQLALKKIHAFSLSAHGFYFWNFRTEAI